MNVFQKIYHLHSNVSVFQEVSDLIMSDQLSDKPAMVARTDTFWIKGKTMG